MKGYVRHLEMASLPVDYLAQTAGRGKKKDIDASSYKSLPHDPLELDGEPSVLCAWIFLPCKGVLDLRWQLSSL